MPPTKASYTKVTASALPRQVAVRQLDYPRLGGTQDISKPLTMAEQSLTLSYYSVDVGAPLLSFVLAVLY